MLPKRVWCFSDETNFAYIVEALQVKKPDTDKVKSVKVASHDPLSASACSNSNGSAGEAAQSVKELFPHLEISHIEVFVVNTTVCLIVFLLETDC